MRGAATGSAPEGVPTGCSRGRASKNGDAPDATCVRRGSAGRPSPLNMPSVCLHGLVTFDRRTYRLKALWVANDLRHDGCQLVGRAILNDEP